MNKSKYLYILILFLFVMITFYRLIELNVFNHDDYIKDLKNKTIIYVDGSSAPRGRILDVNGKVIVDNIGIKTIIYHKSKQISSKEEIAIAKKINQVLNMPCGNIIELIEYWLLLHNNGHNLITKKEYELFKKRKINSNDIKNKKLNRITDNMIDFDEETKMLAHTYSLMNKGYKYENKIIKENCPEEEYAKILEMNIPGITGEITWQRSYNDNNTLRSILGSVGNIPKEKVKLYLKNGYILNDKVGISYLEKQYENYLKGTKAKYLVQNDNTLKLVQEAQKGNDLILSINMDIENKIQEIMMEKMLEAKTKANTEYYKESYALISNPKDGSIVAALGLRLNDDKTFSDITRNIISSSYTIGSSVKGATISVGYKYNLININKKITDSCVKLHLVPKKCSHKKLGRINDLDALAYSSNYYQYMIAINLVGKKYKPNMVLDASKKHFDIYRDMLSSYGLGAKTEIDLPNESKGIKGNKIADDLLLNLAIGQYDSYTPIQVLQYINSIYNGKRMSLSLMKEIQDKNKILLKYKPKVLNEIKLDEQYKDRIRLGFKEVLKRGTGKSYTNQKIEAAGKTGTSESFYDSNNDGKVDVATISSTFAGYFPSDNPRFSIVVMTPNISHKDSKIDYMYFGASKITRKITDFLFENY